MVPATPEEDRLRDWLAREHGIAEPRRLARVDAETLLLSRFPPGFSARVGETLERLDLLGEPDPLARAAADRALRFPREPRVESWRAAACGLIRERAAAAGLAPADAELVETGIESVAAVLRAVLWSNPLTGEPFTPALAERDAYRDALARTEGARDLFTRHFGAFEGRAVVAHCPGAPYARALLESAWRACTGEPPPA